MSHLAGTVTAVVADFDRRVEELASQQLGMFATRQLLLHQGDAERIRHRRSTRRWLPVQRGVMKLLGTPDSYERRVLAQILAARVPLFGSHRCAATVHGLPGFGHLVEVLLERPAQFRRDGVIVHRSTVLPSHHVVTVRGVPVTTVARTLFDLSSVVRDLRVSRAVDTALARNMVDLVSLSRVARDLRARGRRKSTVIRAILQTRGEDFVAPESVLEQEFIDLIEGTDVPPPARQLDIGDQEGWIGRMDFVYRSQRVIVETDGKEGHSSYLDRLADAAKDVRLRSAGWTVLRFGWFDIVHDGPRTLTRLRRALAHTP